jgi:transcriptional regulator with XRE-family HTH domain
MSNKSDNKISENLKKLRKEKGYSLEKVSKLADLSLNTVAKVESGANTNPTIDTLMKIANALQIDLNDLIK